MTTASMRCWKRCIVVAPGAAIGEDAAHFLLQLGRRARLARRLAAAPASRRAALRRRAARSSRASRPAWPSAAHRDRLDHRAAELGRELGDVDRQAFGARHVGHVEGDHQRPAEPLQLEHQAQVHAQVGRVDDGDDRVGRRFAVAPALDHLERDLLVGRGRRQAVGAGQVDRPRRCGRSSAGRCRPCARPSRRRSWRPSGARR